MSSVQPPADATAGDVPPLPEPWRADRPQEPDPARRRPGCALPAVLGCGCLTVLGGIGFVLMVSNARGLIEWQLRPLRRAVESGLPRQIDEAERRRFAAAFDGLPDALTSGRLEPGEVWRFQRQLAEAAAAAQSQTLDRTQAMALLAALEQLVAEAGEQDPERALRPAGVEASWRPRVWQPVRS